MTTKRKFEDAIIVPAKSEQVAKHPDIIYNLPPLWITNKKKQSSYKMVNAIFEPIQLGGNWNASLRLVEMFNGLIYMVNDEIYRDITMRRSDITIKSSDGLWVQSPNGGYEIKSAAGGSKSIDNLLITYCQEPTDDKDFVEKDKTLYGQKVFGTTEHFFNPTVVKPNITGVIILRTNLKQGILRDCLVPCVGVRDVGLTQAYDDLSLRHYPAFVVMTYETVDEYLESPKDYLASLSK